MILAIDPGTHESAYCVVNEKYEPKAFAKLPNEDLIEILKIGTYKQEKLVIEMIASYGMPVGSEVFETCVWIGRFLQVAGGCNFIYRNEEKLNLCGSVKANDSKIRKALIDRFARFDKKNGKGRADKPDWFYGFRDDIWSAYAVAVTYMDKENAE